MKRIAIVGGGIAGLTTAYELAKLAHSGTPVEAVLFESTHHLGGIVETVREGGFILECGPDAWVTEKPWARELAEELTGRHHHHLVCMSCGVVEDFEAPQRVEQGLAEAIGRFASETGFRAETHRLDLLGTCERCAG